MIASDSEAEWSFIGTENLHDICSAFISAKSVLILN